METLVTSEDYLVDRIKQLCMMKKIKINTLANMAGLPPSTLYSILSFKSKNPKFKTICKICIALHISVFEFYNVDMFKELEY